MRNSPPGPHPVCLKLRELRRAAGLSLSQLQDRHGMNAVLVGSYERGDRQPPLVKLDALLHVFGYRLTAVPIGGVTDHVRTPHDMIAELRSITAQLEKTYDVPSVPPAAPYQQRLPVSDQLHLPTPARNGHR
jgi:transcriptional regulator with XRE-family HTH domain